MLPGKDGFELMDLMKEAKIPVIYLTAKKRRGLEDPGTSFRSGRITLSSLSRCWSFWSASKKCWSGPDADQPDHCGRYRDQLNEHQVTKTAEEVS